MQWLSQISVRRPVFATVLILVLVVVGAVGYSSLGVDKFPKVDFPAITIVTPYPGASPLAVESDVSKKVEEAVNTISGLDMLTSTSTEGVSLVVAQFDLEVDPDKAANDINEKLATILRDLPPGLRPEVRKADPDAAPVLVIAVKGPADASVRDLTRFADKSVKQQLERLPGVGQIIILGGQDRQINVQLDPILLASAGVSAIEVQRAIAAGNVNVPGGRIEAGPQNTTLRVEGRAIEADQIGQIVVRQMGGTHPILVRDVAKIVDAEEDAETSAVRNGVKSIALSIRKQSGTNTVAVVDLVKKAVTELSSHLPKGYEVNIVRDNSLQIRTSADQVLEHLIIGSFLAALVVLLFLGSLRSTIIAALSIPVSIISTFGLMMIAGFTLNMMTLLALALAVGIVIDDAIVVLENIYRFIDEKRMKPFPAAIHATKEIGLAVLATTLSLMAVFLPVAFMSGIVGRFLYSFGLTMAFAIAVSMIVAFTLTPMMAARMLPLPPPPGEERRRSWLERGSDFVYRPIARVYSGVLAFCLRHRWVVGIAIIGSCMTTPIMAKKVGGDFLPLNDEAQFEVYIQTPQGTSLEATTLIGERIARGIRQYPEVAATLVTIADTDQREANIGRVYVSMTYPETRTRSQAEIMQLVRENVLNDLAIGSQQAIDKAKDDVSKKLATASAADKPALQAQLDDLKGRTGTRVAAQPVNDFSLGGQNAMVMYLISGPDLDKLEVYGKKVMDHMRAVPGVVDLDSSLVDPVAESLVKPNLERAALLGVDPNAITATLAVLIGGQETSTFEYEGDQYPVFLRAAEQFRNDPSKLSLISVPSSTLGQVPLTDVITVGEGLATSKITRNSRERAVTLTMNVKPGFSQQTVVSEIQKAIKDLNLPLGYTAEPFGQSKEMAKMMKAFVFAILLAIIFMYLVLAAQFESWAYPFIILMSLPLVVPFAIMSLAITGGSLNIMSMLGLIVLFAMVKKNAILQVDHANGLRRQGMQRTEAVLAASRDRLRPILMTTLAFVAGMIPLITSKGVGAGMSKAMAQIVVGGQVLSLLLTLVAIPVIYTWFDDLANFLKRVVGKVLPKGPTAAERGAEEVGVIDINAPSTAPGTEAH
ncbi:MAG TPA: efflux RND transporter permease subunit [Kofleriaceae bacterium]|jgi:multidrug efflux pump subunit AcrB